MNQTVEVLHPALIKADTKHNDEDFFLNRGSVILFRRRTFWATRKASFVDDESSILPMPQQIQWLEGGTGYYSRDSTEHLTGPTFLLMSDHTPYHRRLFDCILFGEKCRSTKNPIQVDPFSPQQSTINTIAPVTSQTFNHFNNNPNAVIQYKSCTPCRVIGTTVFLSGATYCSVIASRALKGSFDRRLSCTLSFAFVILG